MTRYRYSGGAIAGAWARGAGGTLATLGPLVALHPAPWISVALAAAGALFLVYLARAAITQFTQLEIDGDGIRAHGPAPLDLRWDEVRQVRLAYYSTRRDRSHGWMQLVIKGSGKTLRIESTLNGFEEIALAAAREALRRQCALDERTLENLKLLGANAGDYTRGPIAGAVHG